MSRGRIALSVIALAAGGCRSSAPEPRSYALAEEAQVPPPISSRSGAIPNDVPTDAEFWRMSREPEVVAAGRAAFSASSCRTCHGLALTGGAGPNLTDQRWLHGGTPREVYGTILRGVPSKGMPTWGPVLGPKTIGTLVAYIFSYHREGEPIEPEATFTPFTPKYEIP